MKYKNKVILVFTLCILPIICTSCQCKKKDTFSEAERFYASSQKVEDGKTQQSGDQTPVRTQTPVPTQTPTPTPTPTIEPTPQQPVKVKGIYVTGPKAGSGGMDDLISLVEETKINAMVIDVKNDSGEITYNIDNRTAKKIGARKKYVSDMPGLIESLKNKDIYLIARIVAFKDPILAEEKPELALRKKDGSIFRDKSGLAWVNPYKKEVWDYLLEISKEAAALGFDEIQFDYIRFSTDSAMKNVDFGKEAKDKTKEEVITEFTKYMKDNLSDLSVYVSADVYGIIINSEVDQKIVGQDYKDMAENLDYICPMIYPSHYADGSYGVKHPDLDPYTIVKEALSESVMVLEDTKAATVRPWLQDFTASWLSNHQTYDKDQIEAQIQAVEDAGYEEWILWNGSNRYTRLD